MNQDLNALLTALKENKLAFSEVLKFIDERYTHQPTAFENGETYNEATQNQGSARIFSFAQLNKLDADDTLHLFAEHYADVLADPDGTGHQNIRQFMANGWAGIVFEGEALTAK